MGLRCTRIPGGFVVLRENTGKELPLPLAGSYNRDRITIASEAYSEGKFENKADL